MEITENERMVLIQKKNDICKLTQEIIEIMDDETEYFVQFIEIKKKVIEIISLLHIISDFGECSRDLGAFANVARKIIGSDGGDQLTKFYIELFCVYVNAISYTPSSKGLFRSIHGKIGIPGIAELGALQASNTRK